MCVKMCRASRFHMFSVFVLSYAKLIGSFYSRQDMRVTWMFSSTSWQVLTTEPNPGTWCVLQMSSGIHECTELFISDSSVIFMFEQFEQSVHGLEVQLNTRHPNTQSGRIWEENMVCLKLINFTDSQRTRVHNINLIKLTFSITNTHAGPRRLW